MISKDFQTKKVWMTIFLCMCNQFLPKIPHSPISCQVNKTLSLFLRKMLVGLPVRRRWWWWEKKNLTTGNFFLLWSNWVDEKFTSQTPPRVDISIGGLLLGWPSGCIFYLIFINLKIPCDLSLSITYLIWSLHGKKMNRLYSTDIMESILLVFSQEDLQGRNIETIYIPNVFFNSSNFHPCEHLNFIQWYFSMAQSDGFDVRQI